MKVITWNMGYWLHRSQHDEAWAYLREALRPDLALLQETSRAKTLDLEAMVFHEIHPGWGTAIYSRDQPLNEMQYEGKYPGRVVAATASLLNGEMLFLASIHAPIIENRVFPHLSNIVDEVDRMAPGRTAILGGDLNSARLAEDVWPGYGHGPFFEKMDRSRYVNCCWHIHGRELQTYFRPRSKHPFQDDHLFITRELLPRLKSCYVIENTLTRRVSDHIPVMIEVRAW